MALFWQCLSFICDDTRPPHASIQWYDECAVINAWTTAEWMRKHASEGVLMSSGPRVAETSLIFVDISVFSSSSSQLWWCSIYIWGAPRIVIEAVCQCLSEEETKPVWNFHHLENAQKNHDTPEIQKIKFIGLQNNAIRIWCLLLSDKYQSSRDQVQSLKMFCNVFLVSMAPRACFCLEHVIKHGESALMYDVYWIYMFDSIECYRFWLARLIHNKRGYFRLLFQCHNRRSRSMYVSCNRFTCKQADLFPVYSLVYRLLQRSLAACSLCCASCFSDAALVTLLNCRGLGRRLPDIDSYDFHAA